MTRHRVRRRSPTPESVLKNLGPLDRPRDALNQATPDVTRCAWPGCRSHMQIRGLHDQTIQDRYGILCTTHAVDVAISVVQHQTELHRFEQFFAQQSAERILRAEQWRREDEQYEAEKAALRQDSEGFVYYIRIGERIKIGYSVDVKRRMRAYPPGSKLLAVEPGDRERERERHQQFAGSRTDGREWFRPTIDIMELVEELVDVYGDPKRFAHHYRKTEDPVRIHRTS